MHRPHAGIGVLGLGAFGARLAVALAGAGHANCLMLSLRGRHSAEVAARLSLPRLENRDLVDRCEVVFLCVRAADAVACVKGLPWRAGQVLASTCATAPLAPLARACVPAQAVRALPLPGAAGGGYAVLWPAEPRVHDLLSPLGEVLVVPDERTFAASCAAACLYAWAHQLAAWTADWSEAHGLTQAAARSLVSRSLESAGTNLRDSRRTPTSTLLEDIATPGGLSEAGINILRLHRTEHAWLEALEAALGRAQGR